MPVKLEDLHAFGETLKKENVKLKMFWSLIYVVLWNIWSTRNAWIFRKEKPIPMRTADDIQLMYVV